MGKISVLVDQTSEAFSTAKRATIDQALKESTEQESVAEAAQFPVPVYQVIDGINHIIHSDKPAAITLGHNRNYQTKSQIAVVAGTLGSLVAENDPESNNPVEVAYPTPVDAASIVVSEMADFGDYNGRSVVTAKADVVGLRAAELIELRAGGIPYLANGHQTTNKYGGIHLIAGDKTEGKDFDLQPIVKGENLKKMMVDLIEFVQNLITQVTMLNNDVRSLKSDLIDHTHPIKILVNSFGSAGPFPATVAGTVIGFTNKSFGLASSLSPTFADSARITTNLSGIDDNFSVAKYNYLEQTSPLPIKSRFNKVN